MKPCISKTKCPGEHKNIHCCHNRVDTDVLMEVAYSCNFLAVSDSSTCPDIGTR